MEPEKSSAQIKDKDLFKAAESGDSSLFKSLPEEQLLKSLSLRNEDDRSLLHVAVSFGHSEVISAKTSKNCASCNSFRKKLYCIYNVKIIFMYIE